MIYLDYNASVPLRSAAKEALLKTLAFVGNPSSPHQAGRHLRSLVEEARTEILKGLGGKRLVFTSGGTEANVLALSSAKETPVIVSSIEHESVLKAVEAPYTVPVLRTGVIDLEALEKLLTSFERPGLLSVMLVNNETGVIQPMKEVARLAHAKRWKVHTDVSQAIGHLPFSCEDLDVDMMTLSSHKCGGPVGVGALILREAGHVMPLIRGGGQEYGIRGGTLAAPLIVGFAAAVNEAIGEDMSSLKKLQQKIEKALPDAIMYGKESPRTAHVACIGMPMVSSDLQLMAFDLKGIAVSAGAACSSGTMKSSHVLAAMGVSALEAGCAIRVSMGWNTQSSDIDAFIDEWNIIYGARRLKEAS
jgi:cysteine desulfurase